MVTFTHKNSAERPSLFDSAPRWSMFDGQIAIAAAQGGLSNLEAWLDFFDGQQQENPQMPVTEPQSAIDG